MKFSTLLASCIAALILTPVITSPASAQRVETESVVCQSENRSRTECRVRGRIQTVQPRESYSLNPCIFNFSWGYDERNVWVDQGCYASFDVTVERGRAQPEPAPLPVPTDGTVTQSIVCESTGRRRVQCPVDGTIVSAEAVASYSQRPCRQGRTWGYEADHIWVRRGCHAEFSVDVALNQPEPVAPPPPPEPVDTGTSGLEASPVDAILAQGACTGLFAATGKPGSYVFAVKRDCRDGGPTCDQVCRQAASGGGDLLDRWKIKSLSCYNSVHVYGAGVGGLGTIGTASYVYNSCATTGCGPNYCCCASN